LSRNLKKISFDAKQNIANGLSLLDQGKDLITLLVRLARHFDRV
jgi:hypothetical protein